MVHYQGARVRLIVVVFVFAGWRIVAHLSISLMIQWKNKQTGAQLLFQHKLFIKSYISDTIVI